MNEELPLNGNEKSLRRSARSKKKSLQGEFRVKSIRNHKFMFIFPRNNVHNSSTSLHVVVVFVFVVFTNEKEKHLRFVYCYVK